MTCDEVRGEVAAALLTRATVPEPAAAHVRGCAACRAAVDELRPLPALLAAAPPPAPSDADDLLPRLLAAAAAERRHRRRAALLWSTAAAAAVVLLAAGLLGALMLRTPVEPTASATATGSRTAGTVTADAVLHPAPTGGALVDVAVSGLPPGTVCTVQAVTGDGTRYPVTTWRVGDYGTGHVHGQLPAGVPATSVTTVELVDSRGVLLAHTTPRPGSGSVAS